MSEPIKGEVKPWTKKDTLNVLGGGALGILGLFGIGKVASKVGEAVEQSQQENAMNRHNEILAHQAKVLETDDTLGIENAVAQFQVECKGQKLSTFVITQKDEHGWPKVFTNYKGQPVELLTWKTSEGDNSTRDWYIPGTDVPEGEKGIKGAIGMQTVLRYRVKPELDDRDREIFYFPPDDENSRKVSFKENEEIAYRFKASDLPRKVQESLVA